MTAAEGLATAAEAFATAAEAIAIAAETPARPGDATTGDAGTTFLLG